VIGGYDGDGLSGTDHAEVYIFNPTNNTWAAGPSLPDVRDGGVATAPDFPLQTVNLIYPANGATCCIDTFFVWNRGDGACKIVYAGAGSTSGAPATCWRLNSVVQGYVLRCGTDPGFGSGSYSQTWNDMDGVAVDDRDTTDPLLGASGSFLPNTWYYWKVGVVDDMGDTAWSATWSFYHCEPAYFGSDEGQGKTGPWLEPFVMAGEGPVQLVFSTPEPGRYEMSVYDVTGKLAYSDGFRAESGDNTLNLDIRGSGLYLIVLRGEGQEFRSRVILAR